MMPSSQATHHFAAHVAFKEGVNIASASVGGSTSVCDIGDAPAGGACGLRCGLGTLRNGDEAEMMFVADLPGNSPLSVVQANMCICVEDMKSF